MRPLEKEKLLKRISVKSLPELEKKLLEAAQSLDASRGEDGEEVFARLRKRAMAPAVMAKFEQVCRFN